MIAIEKSSASISTLSVEVKALRVGGKQITLAMFNQIPEQGIFLKSSSPQEEIKLAGTPWGIVRYPSKDRKNEDFFVVFDNGKTLFKYLCSMNYFKLLKMTVTSWNLELSITDYRDNVTDVDLRNLVRRCNSGDMASIEQLEQVCYGCGFTKEQVEDFKSWEEVKRNVEYKHYSVRIKYTPSEWKIKRVCNDVTSKRFRDVANFCSKFFSDFDLDEWSHRKRSGIIVSESDFQPFQNTLKRMENVISHLCIFSEMEQLFIAV